MANALATETVSAPSLSRCPFRRYSSEIRTGCANKRPSGSVEGVVSNHDPYSDQHQLRSILVSEAPTSPEMHPTNSALVNAFPAVLRDAAVRAASGFPEN